jgi:hypothetical protein
MTAKNIKAIMSILLAACLAWASAKTPMAAAYADTPPTSLVIDQAYADMPEVVAYLRLDAASPVASEDVSATLGPYALGTESVAVLGESGGGTLYIVLVDVSTSMGASQMREVKAALSQFCDRLLPEDRVLLMTFANEPQVLTDGSQPSEAVRSAIDSLSLVDGETSLNDAMVRAVQLSAVQNDDLPAHRVCILITDGINEKSGTGYTGDDVTSSLKDAHLPVFALVVRGLYGRNQAAIDTLSSLALNSGGQAAYVEASGYATELAHQQAMVQQTMRVVLSAETNQVSGQVETLAIQVNAGGNVIAAIIDLPVTSFKPDDDLPVASALQVDDTHIRVSFSRPVSGAGEAANYVLTDMQGRQVAVIGAEYADTPDGPVAELILGERVDSGRYQLRFLHINDLSQEQHPLSDVLDIEMTGRPPQERFMQALLVDYWWVLLIIALAVAMAVAFVVIKRHRGLVKVEGRIGFGDAVEYQQHFSTPESDQISLIVTDTSDEATRVVLNINKSIFVGRSKENNLSFDDDKLSRQHFAIELEDGVFYLLDLESTNGSYLNGVPVRGRRRLEVNDVITAGNEKLVFKGPVQ